jgi:sigma-E factor negative regulatory protein RseB
VKRLVLLAGGAVLLAAVTLALLSPGSAPSEPSGADAGRIAPDGHPEPDVDPAAWRLLDRAAAAPRTTAYAGTQFVSAWEPDGTTSQVLAVTSSPSEGTTWRVAGSSPGAGPAVHAAAQAADPSILGAGAVTLLARHYSLAVAGAARVAGRTTDVVEAHRPGASGPADAVAARFWLDRATGLVLRREVYDARGRVVRASAFVDVTVTEAEPVAGTAAGRAWPDSLDGAAVRRMRARGWDCPDALPGPLPLVDARRGGHQGQIVHLSYADGLASVSVFQQRGHLDRDRLDGYRLDQVGGRPVWVRPEVPRRVVWASDGTVYTVVADAPERTVDRAVRALREQSHARGADPMDRLGRGLDRVASWFNPFE